MKKIIITPEQRERIDRLLKKYGNEAHPNNNSNEPIERNNTITPEQQEHVEKIIKKFIEEGRILPITKQKTKKINKN